MVMHKPIPAQPLVDRPARIEAAIERALENLQRRQLPSGAWPGDYGGPLFLLPMYIGTCHIAGLPIDESIRREMVRYLENHQNPDGGWGLHVEAPSYVFTTSLNYVAMRLLGVAAEDPRLARARRWLAARGGPKRSASWGKFFLSLLGLYDYDGLNPVPPELWLLPEALPVHPSRLWCHCRMVYMPMSYLYGMRARAPETDLTRTLRAELYDEPYDEIDWNACRNTVAPEDTYIPHSPLVRAVNEVLYAYEQHRAGSLRKRSLDFVLDQIRREDDNTNFICIGPINKLFNLLSWHFTEPGGSRFQAHVERLEDYLYHADDGVKMQGYNSSQLWDTAFAIQAIAASGRSPLARDLLERAHDYLEQNQVLEDVPERERGYRDPSKGGWPFSNRAHGWPISDCTAEGLKSSLLLENDVDHPIGEDRLTDAAKLILSMQNADGGWATYELTRGPRWLELLNPSDCFGDIMIDYSWVECTSACVQALARFQKRYPHKLGDEIARAIDRGSKFIQDIQRPDGSWEGAWGVCFTYGTWFGVAGLRAAGLPADHPAIERACAFLVSHQSEDGGWGESIESCRERRYIETDESQAVMTAWATLALIDGGRKGGAAVRRAIDFLLDRQRTDGSFPAEHIAGVFNKTSAIHYDNYLNIFPLWALSRAR